MGVKITRNTSISYIARDDKGGVDPCVKPDDAELVAKKAVENGYKAWVEREIIEITTIIVTEPYVKGEPHEGIIQAQSNVLDKQDHQRTAHPGELQDE